MNQTFALFAALALLPAFLPAAAAEPSACSDLVAECDDSLCLAFTEPEPACSTIGWPECAVQTMGYAWCVDLKGECKVVETHGDQSRCLGEPGPTHVEFPDCTARVSYGADGYCVDPDGPCFVSEVRGEATRCTVGLP